MNKSASEAAVQPVSRSSDTSDRNGYELGDWLWEETIRLFRAIGLSTPSVWQVARELAYAPHGLTVSSAATRTGLSPTSVRKASRRLAGLHIQRNSLCIVERPQRRGRGYETRLICEHHQIAQFKRDSSRSHTPKTYGVKTIIEENRGHGQAHAGGGHHSTATGNVNDERPRPTTRRARQDELDSLSDDVVLVRGARFWRYAAERLRILAWEAGASRPCSQAISSVVLSNVTGRPIREFRRYLGILQDEHAASVLVKRADWCLENRDLKLTYAAIRSVLTRQLQGKLAITRRPVDDRGFDLRTVEGREKYRVAVMERLDGRSECECPRCGGEILSEVWNSDEPAWRPFDPYGRYDGECSCIYLWRARVRGVERDPSKSPVLGWITQRGADHRITTELQQWVQDGNPDGDGGIDLSGSAVGRELRDWVKEGNSTPKPSRPRRRQRKNHCRQRRDRATWEREQANTEAERWARDRDAAAAQGIVLDYRQWKTDGWHISTGLPVEADPAVSSQKPAYQHDQSVSEADVEAFVDEVRAELVEAGVVGNELERRVADARRAMEKSRKGRGA